MEAKSSIFWIEKRFIHNGGDRGWPANVARIFQNDKEGVFIRQI